MHLRRSRLLAMLSLALTLAVGAAVASPAHALNPYQRGPNPTDAILEASSGPYATSSISVPSIVSGFGGGRIYYPTTTADGTFGGIAISPGFTATWSSLSWLGPRLASHGFVVIGIETNTIYDQPTSRGQQLLAALDYLVNTSSVRTRVDSSRLAVAGHSMGGGGTLWAANSRPSLQAAIPLAPWNTDKSWSGVRVPTLIVGGQSDTVAPVATHSIPFYTSIPAASEKAYLELRSASHFFPQTVNTTVAVSMVSWLKRYVDDDTRYDPWLCPGPSGLSVSDYRDTCPA
ncbi:alpha-beta hydrolase superfamily lysophospholipase [Hamadaea flava]|uniref:Alpha/beta hydrolase family protein n=1 Tax=Hamadaea flava TaxID=1742688 RepID=A0ABV8LVF2_9ACTN|nr:alpha/beta hydrolase [Hamadaea flava]MCP2329078.1 alpha-beta hydrolase superfamily lysophospholipase [Hamadaea flava]